VSSRALTPLITLAVAGAVSLRPTTSIAQARQASAVELQDHSIALGSYHLHTVVGGTGGPVVVFEAGMGDGADSWKTVQPQIATLTQTLSYDRPGLGQSERAPELHDLNQSADELHKLLEMSGARGPYIVVGHSMGGLIVRAFAHRYPHDIAGMVLVDPSDEGVDVWLHAALSPVDWQAYVTARQQHLQDPVMHMDMYGVTRASEVAGASLPDVPKILLSRTVVTEVGIWRTFREAGIALHREWVQKTPRAELIEVPTADHYIQRAAPDVVIGAIRRVLNEVKPE
jgi:pimeloyl-ACP methyl ester carboxylesterase